jgi:hypothetical protein
MNAVPSGGLVVAATLAGAIAVAPLACSDGSASWSASPIGGGHGTTDSGSGHAADSGGVLADGAAPPGPGAMPENDGGGVTSGPPAISITMPQDGAAVTVIKPDDTVEVWFVTSHFLLARPGTCPATLANTDHCGHVHLLVDGAACTPDGSADDDEGFVSPVVAILADCPMVDRSHTLTAELHHDDHAPILDRNHKIVSASVTVTASGG